MVSIIGANKIAYEIVEKAIIRSHGLGENYNNIYVFISPNAADEIRIKKLVLTNSKILVLGKISTLLASFLGLKRLDKKEYLTPPNHIEQGTSFPDSLLKVVYDLNHVLNINNPLDERVFHRFDFTNEWNNLGYGKIRTNESVWSLSQALEAESADVIGSIYEENRLVSVFASLKSFNSSSVLFINREIGLVDGLDWVVIEEFFAGYKCLDLPSLPLIVDIPYGCNSVASFRFDCDQSILNTKPIVDLYKKYEIDVSLAIATGIDINEDDVVYLNNFFNGGGAILSHSVNHYESWGNSYQQAYNEAYLSKQWLEKNIVGLDDLKYAVSPFHTNQVYSVQALLDAGYKGFIAGIIHNDPEFLTATSGKVPFIDGAIVTHSEQCMFHGDCPYQRKGVNIYKRTFENHFKAKKMFGFLDHPFGDYHYGWSSENDRVSVHEDYINFINSFPKVKWMTGTKILDFILDKSNLTINLTNNNLSLKRNFNNSEEKILVIYKNKEYIC